MDPSNRNEVASDTVSDDRVDKDAYRAALGFLYNRINYERMASGTSRYPFRLHRMGELARRLGLRKYLAGELGPTIPIVHLAGTKGKGSTAAMVSAALAAGGVKTGLYTSPHLHDLEERFRVNGQPCSQSDLVSLVGRVRPVAKSMGDESIGAAFFELTTALALLHFDTQACEAIVLEVGLGGRLDSTNVCRPAVTGFTSIGLDHQHVLGHTLAEVAGEKAGIIKDAVPVVSGVAGTTEALCEAEEVIMQRAARHSAPLYQLGRDFTFDHVAKPDWGSCLSFHGHAEPLTPELSIDLQMDGRHQAANAAVAIAIIDLLRSQGITSHNGQSISANAVRHGLEQLTCAGRLERFMLPEDLLVIVDAAHNEDSISALCQCIQDRRRDRSVTVVFGTSRDKDAVPMLKRLTKVSNHLILTQFAGNPRFQPAENLLSDLAESSQAVRVIRDPIQACHFATTQAGKGSMLVVCGSFFLAAETRRWFAQRSV